MSAPVEAYESKEEFYKSYGRLGRGWGSLDHTNAPGGLDTALSRIRREGPEPADSETWAIMVACPYPESHNLVFGGKKLVPGAVVATSSRTGRVFVLFTARDIRSAFDVLRELEKSSRRPSEVTFEEIAAAISSPYKRYGSIPGMRFSEHFERDRQDAVDRREITLEMCAIVRAEPLEQDSESQPRGRTAYWGYVAEKDRYLKIVVEADGEEIVTAHWDRGFKRKMKRREGDG